MQSPPLGSVETRSHTALRSGPEIPSEITKSTFNSPMTPEEHPREARLAAKQTVDAELTKARTQLAKLRCERDAMVIALRKGELIKRYDAKVQLSFGITTLRQRLMSFSRSLPPRLVDKSEHAIGQIIDAEVRSALTDIASWPAKLGRPDWDEEIDEELRPHSGGRRQWRW